MQKFIPKALFLDLDGVFFDFDGGVRRITGKSPHQLHKGSMWAAIHSDKMFFRNLELLPHAKDLWAYTKTKSPTFLTGAPSSHAFREQKKESVAFHFGPEWTTIVLPKKDKQLYSGEGMILLDDSIDNIDQWNTKGGRGVLFTEFDKALAELKALYGD